MIKVRIDLEKIIKAAEISMGQTALAIHRAALEVIAEPGVFDGFDGDIIDTGKLRDSQRIDIKSRSAILRNTVDYANAVRSGYTRRNGATVGGRDWMAEAIRRVDPQNIFEKLLRSKL